MKNKEAVELLQTIQDEYGVDIVSKERDRHTSDLRKMYCAFVYRHTRLTLQNLSEILQKSIGNVSYYLSSHDKQMGEGGAYADHYTDFQERMKESATI